MTRFLIVWYSYIMLYLPEDGLEFVFYFEPFGLVT